MRKNKRRAPYWLITLMVLPAVWLLAGCTGTPAAPAATPTPAPPTQTPPPSATPLPTATPGLPLGGGTLRLNEPLGAALLPEVPARFLFAGERLQTFGLTVTPQQEVLDIRVSLRDADRDLLVVDRGGPGEAERIPQYGLLTNGTYEIRVEIVAGAGDVVAELTRFPPEDWGGGGTLTLVNSAGEMAGEVTAPDTRHVFAVPVKGGDVLVFEVDATSGDLDPFFELYDDRGQLLGIFDNEDGVNARSGDTYIPFDGQYSLLVGGQGEGTGEYVVRVRPE